MAMGKTLRLEQYPEFCVWEITFRYHARRGNWC